MKNNTKKIVVLDRLNSPRIEQAIFILRDENDVIESDAVSEAERIVKNYLTSGYDTLSKENKKHKHAPWFFLGIVVHTILTATLTMAFFSRLG